MAGICSLNSLPPCTAGKSYALSIGLACSATAQMVSIQASFRPYISTCAGMGTKGGRFGRSALKDPLMKDPDIMHPNPYLCECLPIVHHPADLHLPSNAVSTHHMPPYQQPLE